MHEYSIVQALLERVEREARQRGAAAVTAVRVRIGDASGVDRELLVSAFEVFRARSICEHADFEVVAVRARWQCPRCGDDLVAGRALACPSCAGPARLVEGDEIVLDRIEMEVG